MSISSNQSAILRIQNDIANLQKKVADESKKEATLLKQIQQTHSSITKSSSVSTVSSKLNQIARYNEDIARCNSKKATLAKDIARKTSELHRYQTQLAKDEENERKKLETERKKQEKEQLDFQRKLTREMEAKTRAIQSQISLTKKRISEDIQQEHLDSPEYDVFISHASEDKESFARPFAEHLKQLGIKVWYDELSLQWGDSLRTKIDQGLANSRFGIVVISKEFIKKNWTEYELNGLVAKEINGSGRILPIWHEISKSEVLKFSPSLADKKALTTSDYTIDEMAEQLLPMLKE
ncbi:TIR domain-containing protein [Providencia rettgeri]